MQKRILCYAIACLFSVTALSQTTVTLIQDKPIWDLRLENATNMSASDDGTSQVFNFGFDFNFFGETFNQGYMASNGCLILGSLSTASTWEKNCTQYNPSPSPNTNYTMYPFWTDLVMGENSSMLAKSFDDKVIFGWYEMWEYYRDSKNTFELWLYPNHTYEAIYGQLDIKDHDVFIGIQGNEKEFETYYFHDECNTGVFNSTNCVNQDWNDIGENQTLENGGSIFVGEVVDCSNPLNDTSCPDYAAAYQTQQCDINQLYSESCPCYWEAYDDLQCSLDPQYGPFCQGYQQENSVAYFEEEEVFDYGYQEEYDMYDTYQEPEVFEEQTFEPEYDTFEEPEFVFEEQTTFEPVQEYEQFVESFEVMQEEEVFMPTEDLMVEEFIFQETFLVEDYTEPETFIELETVEELEEWFEEETRMEEELAYAEEPEEEFIEEVFEEEVVEEVFEDIEEMREEMEEERLAEVEEERVEELQEEEIVVSVGGKSSISREMALNVVSSTLSTAQASVSGTTSGNSIHATGGTTGASSVSSSNSGGGVSTSNSPSISEQFASSTAQNNQVLDMSASVTSSTSVEAETVETVSVAVDTTTTQTLQSEIDMSVSTDSSANQAEQTVANVIAQNLQAAQEDVEAKQEETGEYGSENTIIAYMGFVPNFNNYRLVTLPDQETWYESTDIYANNMLSDNIEGFYQMAGQSLETLIEMRELQPKL